MEDVARLDADSDGAKEKAHQITRLFDNPLDLSKVDYRGKIVSSTISLFDFQTYIFSRQLALLLRLGNYVGDRTLMQNAEPAKPLSDDDMVFLASACKRAPAFIASNVRVFRRELGIMYAVHAVPDQTSTPVSYTHLTLPTKRIV